MEEKKTNDNKDNKNEENEITKKEENNIKSGKNIKVENSNENAKKEEKKFPIFSFGENSIFKSSSSNGQSLFGNNNKSNDNKNKDITPVIFSTVKGNSNPFLNKNAESDFFSKKVPDKNEDITGNVEFFEDGEKCKEIKENEQNKDSHIITPLNQAGNSNFKKKFSKHINKFYTFKPGEKCYKSRGNGFLSIETTEENNKKIATIIFRNQMGVRLIEGFLNENVDKLSFYEKNNKQIVDFCSIDIKEEGNSLLFCKVPFENKNDFEEFKKVYENAIKYIKN